MQPSTRAFLADTWLSEIPRDTPGLEAFSDVVRRCSELVGEYREKLQKATPIPTPDEVREAEAKGAGAIEALYARKKRELAKNIALESMQEVAKMETRVESMLAADDNEELAQALPEAWNEVSLRLDRWEVERFLSWSDAQRKAALSRIEQGDYATMARSLLRVWHTAPELLDDPLDGPLVDLTTARRIAGAILAKKDAKKAAAIKARRAAAEHVKGQLRLAVKALRTDRGITDSQIAAVMGDSFSRLFLQRVTP